MKIEPEGPIWMRSVEKCAGLENVECETAQLEAS